MRLFLKLVDNTHGVYSTLLSIANAIVVAEAGGFVDLAPLGTINFSWNGSLFAVVDFPNSTLPVADIRRTVLVNFVNLCRSAFGNGVEIVSLRYKVDNADSLVNLNPADLISNLEFVEVVVNNNTLLAGKLSELAYEDGLNMLNQDRTVVCEGLILTVQAFLDGQKNQTRPSDAQGYVFTERDTVYVAFRGTWHSVEDAWDDLQYSLARCNDIGIKADCMHKGFVRQFESIVDQLRECLDTLPPWKTIIFCGHSLGGALATLACAWYCLNRNPEGKNIHVFTFGAPRVGNAKFCEVFKTLCEVHSVSHLRVVNAEDSVTREPPGLFSHVPFGLMLTLSYSVTSVVPHVGVAKGEIDLARDSGIDDGYGVFLYNFALYHSITNVYLPRLNLYL